MGLVGKLASKAAKAAAVSAATVLCEKGYSKIQEARTSQTRQKKDYPKQANFSIYVIDRFSRPLSEYVVRDEMETILYYIKVRSSGKQATLYAADESELFTLSAAKYNRAIVRHAGQKIGEVRQKLSLTGLCYTLSWLDWKVETNLLGTERTFLANEKEIAKTKFFITGQDSHLIYIKKQQDLEPLLITTFSINAINSYNTEKSSSSASIDAHKPYSDNGKRTKAKQEKKTRHKKIKWASWADLNDAPTAFDDDDDD